MSGITLATRGDGHAVPNTIRKVMAGAVQGTYLFQWSIADIATARSLMLYVIPAMIQQAYHETDFSASFRATIRPMTSTLYRAVHGGPFPTIREEDVPPLDVIAGRMRGQDSTPRNREFERRIGTSPGGSAQPINHSHTSTIERGGRSTAAVPAITRSRGPGAAPPQLQQRFQTPCSLPIKRALDPEEEQQLGEDPLRRNPS